MKHVRDALIVLIVGFVLFFALTARAQAAEDHGQMCWTFTGGLVDRLRLSVFKASDHHLGAHVSEDIFIVNAMWRAFSYQLLGAGTMAASYPTTGLFHGGLNLSNPSPSFNGNRTCTAHLSLDPVSLNGTWALTCTGTGAPFTTSGGLEFDADCSGPFTPPAFSAQAHGDAPREAGDPQ